MRPTGPNAHLWLRDPAERKAPPVRSWVLEKLIDGKWTVMQSATQRAHLDKNEASFGGTTRIRKKARGE